MGVSLATLTGRHLAGFAVRLVLRTQSATRLPFQSAHALGSLHSKKKSPQLLQVMAIYIVDKSISRLTTEVVKCDIFRWNTQAIQCFHNGVIHHWRSAEIVFDFFGFRVIFQILLEQYGHNETSKTITSSINIFSI